MRQQLVDWAKGQVASWGEPRNAAPSRETVGSFDAGYTPRSSAPLQLRRLDQPWTSRSDLAPGSDLAAGNEISPLPVGEGQGVRAAESSADPAVESTASRHCPSALQIHNRYLVTETEEGVTIIDQHALHERILYEHLRQRVAAGAMEMQSLLVPEPVDLSPSEAAAALENRELLAELGMKVEPFGGDTVLIAGYPAMLANISPAEVLRALLEEILSDVKRPDSRDVLDELLHTIACKAAIKAGDRLAPEEISSLLEQRHLIADAHHCPHGRPTALVFTREELDKQFKRI
jgi:DNA mismatch repair protein MutL